MGLVAGILSSSADPSAVFLSMVTSPSTSATVMGLEESLGITSADVDWVVWFDEAAARV